ncbi:flagellar basal body L-ring protein FlgH [Marinibactrum halimedae]|uniref:Flagellar L-ring protein n=1 Tax=Marinibactrum halimedae TaxID=1444977 RepID=A0AA37T3M3_9GAMM|nr:flagellar basal body L-ring protein FlgH [Marinibactrum halimedae]MCD9458388.1 flagellar basal body L-ring protein FlgH [Marinibactrum halimedae]GLS26085.1 flagellar L-ring protein [Marinibactrum halimedae]
MWLSKLHYDVGRHAFLWSCLWLVGCASQPIPRPGEDPFYAPIMAPSGMPLPTANGSLFSANTSMMLYGDARARRVGDVITVLLQERTVSTKSSQVSVVKDSEVQLNEAPILGTGLSASNLSLLTDINANRDFSGEADADQSNSLQGEISVTVADVLQNGNLIVRGEKWITLNRGDEFIRISGIVRPEDVSTTNTVVSTRIANAKISYSGTGELADSQEMGWLSKFFNSPVWPF